MRQALVQNEENRNENMLFENTEMISIQWGTEMKIPGGMT